jgi:cell division inhibitor SepF
MEELELQDRPGILSKLTGLFGRSEANAESGEAGNSTQSVYQVRTAYRYSVTVRREISSFDDAYAAANGLKRGDQQVLNLTFTDPVLRQKIVDFMAGVAFAQEANWEEIGDHIYLVAPSSAFVEVEMGDGTISPRYTNSFFSN